MNFLSPSNSKFAAIFVVLFSVTPLLKAQTVLDFAGSTYTNNQGGVSTVHKWANLGQINSVSFDLIATHIPLTHTNYTGGGGGTVGGVGSGTGYGYIGMPQSTAGLFEFSFVESSDNTNAFTIPNLDFSLLDIDHYTAVTSDDPNNIGRENVRWNSSSVNSGGSMSLLRQGDQVQDVGGNADYDNRFKSIDTLLSQVDNPTDPNALTQEQFDHSLKIGFTNVSSFQIRFGNSEPVTSDGGGRKFFFSGTSTLVPEPSSSMLVGLGSMIVLFRRSRS